MTEFSLDYMQYCDLAALVEAERDRRLQLLSLWESQLNECCAFYFRRGEVIRKRERAAARDAFLKLNAERRAKIKPRELTVEQKESIARGELMIHESESFHRQRIIWESFISSRDIVSLFHKCISYHYQFSRDLRNYAEARQPAPEELEYIKACDRHLPQALLAKIRQKREAVKVEKEKPFERLQNPPNVNYE